MSKVKVLRCNTCGARLHWRNGFALDDSDFKPEVCPSTGEKLHWPVTIEEEVKEPSNQDFQAAHIESLEKRLDTAKIRFNFAANWLGELLCSDGIRKAELICYLRDCANEVNPSSNVHQEAKKLLTELAKPNNGLGEQP